MECNFETSITYKSAISRCNRVLKIVTEKHCAPKAARLNAFWVEQLTKLKICLIAIPNMVGLRVKRGLQATVNWFTAADNLAGVSRMKVTFEQDC